MNRLITLLPILTGVFFGSVGVFIRYLYAAGFDGITIIFTRFSGAMVLLLIYIAIRDRSLLRIRLRDWWIFVLCGLCCTLCTNLCFNISASHLTLSLAATLLAIFPVYVLFISAVFFHEKITWRKIICLILAICGCVMVTGVIGSHVVLDRFGLAAGIMSGISYGLYGIFSKFAVDRGYRGFTITFYAMVSLAIGTAPFADYGAIANYVSAAPASHVGFLLLHSLCVGVLSYITYTIAIEHMDPGKASILASCEPIAAMIFGIIIFGEVPTIIMVLGLIIMLVALTVMGSDKDEGGKS